VDIVYFLFVFGCWLFHKFDYIVFQWIWCSLHFFV